MSERLTQILPPERQDALWSSAVRTPWHWKDTSGSVLLLSITVWQRFRVAGNPRSSSFETSSDLKDTSRSALSLSMAKV